MVSRATVGAFIECEVGAVIECEFGALIECEYGKEWMEIS